MMVLLHVLWLSDEIVLCLSYDCVVLHVCALLARHRLYYDCVVLHVCALSATPTMIILCASLLLCRDFNWRCQCFVGMLIYFRSGEFLALGGCPLFRRGHAEFFRGSTSILSNYSLALCTAQATMAAPVLCEQTPLR